MSVEDYISYYAHFDTILEEAGIVVERQDPQADIAARALELEAVISKYTEEPKPEPTLEHDAWLMAYVEMLQDGAQHFIDSPAFLMTTDHSLIRCQRHEPSLCYKAAIAILPSQLVQVLRFVTPSKDYDRAFLDLFAKRFVPRESMLDNAHINEILARIATYRGTPNLAERILLDDLFARQFVEVAASDEQKQQLIHDTLLAKAEELEAELQEKIALVEQLRRENDQLRSGLSAAQELGQVLTAELGQKEREISQLQSQEEQLTQQLTQLREELEQLQIWQRQQQERKERLVRNAKRVGMAVFFALFLGLLPVGVRLLGMEFAPRALSYWYCGSLILAAVPFVPWRPGRWTLATLGVILLYVPIRSVSLPHDLESAVFFVLPIITLLYTVWKQNGK